MPVRPRGFTRSVGHFNHGGQPTLSPQIRDVLLEDNLPATRLRLGHLHEPLRENGANTAEKYSAAYHVVKYPAAFGECQFSIHGMLDSASPAAAAASWPRNQGDQAVHLICLGTAIVF